MKKLLLSVGLLMSMNTMAQTVSIDSIPNPECISGNVAEPGLAINSAGKIYYGGFKNTFYSTNNGATWNTSTYNWSGGMSVMVVAISPVNGNVYIGGSRFAMSTDGGVVFEKTENFECKDIYAAPNGNVFVILDGGLFRYDTPDLSGGRILLLRASASLNNISMGENGELFAVGKKKIFISLDAGQTWVLKKELTSGNNEFRHVIAGAGGKIFYGETNVNLHQTDTTFVPDNIVSCYTGMNSIKTSNGFMFFPEKQDWWSFSFDNGNSFVKYYGSGFNTLVNGATVPRMSYQARNVNGLAVYNNKIYYAGANCVITVLSSSTITGVEENEINNQILVYPNPISKNEQLTISGVQPTNQVIVRDVLGKEMAHFVGTSKIHLNNYKSGIYFLSVLSESDSKTVKFIVE